MRLLVVEDQERVASFIMKGLREEGYSCDLAADGEQALEHAIIESYDLIVMDVMLPKRDGLAVTQDLRARGLTTPILLLSARHDTSVKVRGLDAGADDYLTKPFAFEELVARIRALLRRGTIVNEPILQLHDLSLDPATREVTRAGTAITLTVKEYSLLEYLLRNKRRIVTRTSIIEHVWDIHFDSDTNLVDVYIRYLRRKIDEPFEGKLIHTVRGVGYVLKEAP
ncbi:MAG: two-component system copper resistance phosphate regulon response regulator CusR [Rhodothermales bacterium]|jgi:two-component system copper resistance phosphate regulon response regulator CusR